jgi:CheY-like chemotaxis protein/HPt (histidine-containing phosphotransfer) domain-containing protein
MTSGNPNLDGIIEDFVIESGESLDLAVDDVLSLERGPDREAIDRIFRVVHTIKGTAGMLNFTGLSGFVHRLEDACADIRAGRRKVDKQVTDSMLGALDLIRSRLDVIRETGREDQDHSPGEECLRGLLAATDRSASPCVAQEAATPSPGTMDELLLLAGGKRTCRTLIVEDDFLCRKLLYSFLSRFSICHVAKDGCEAIQAVTQSYIGPDPEPFSLIFMDIQMPIIDGLRATRAIRAMEQAKGSEHENHRAGIFIVSSVDDSATIRAAVREYGGDFFLGKPLDLNDLKDLLVRQGFFPAAPAQGHPLDGRRARTEGADMEMATGTAG